LIQVSQIWRYPVKSMQGERLQDVVLSERGIRGDRVWAVRDEVRGGIRGAKKIPALMRCRSRYLEPPSSDAVVAAEISLPDGTTVMSDASSVSADLSAALGHEVTLWPLQPATDLDHYRRGAPDHDDLETELREMFAVTPEEDLPDLSKLPPQVFEFESPPGTYFDAFPLLIVSEASLARLAELTPESRIDVRRFRPNLLLSSNDGASGFAEMEWIGRRFRLGECEIAIETECPRCVMTTLGFADLPKDPVIMRTLVREADHNFGVYAGVARGGMVRVGDTLEEI